MAPEPGPPGDVTILEDEPEAREPSDEEIREYAEFLGIDIDKEPYLEWIAREGVVAPVPYPWKACTENGEDVFYFNFESAESVWDHPCDEKYRNMAEEYRQKYQEEQARRKAVSDSEPAATNGQTSADAVGGDSDREGDHAEDEADGEADGEADAGVKTRWVDLSCSLLDAVDEAAALEVSVESAKTSGSNGTSKNGLTRQKAAVRDPLDLSGSGASAHSVAASEKSVDKAEEKQAPVRSPAHVVGQDEFENGVLKARLQPITNEISDESSMGSDGEACSEMKPSSKVELGADVVDSKRDGDCLSSSTTPLETSVDRGLAGVGLATPRGGLSSSVDRSAPTGGQLVAEAYDEDFNASLDSSEVSGGVGASASMSASNSSARPPLQRGAGLGGSVAGVPKPSPSPGERDVGSSLAAVGAPVAAAAAGQALLNGHSGKNSNSNVSEVSEDLTSEFDITSPTSSNHGGRHGDSLEFSASAATMPEACLPFATLAATASSALPCPRHEASQASTAAAASKAAQRHEVPAATGPQGDATRWRRAEAQVQSLTRSLAMLRDIRAKQQEYLRLLQAGI